MEVLRLEKQRNSHAWNCAAQKSEGTVAQSLELRRIEKHGHSSVPNRGAMHGRAMRRKRKAKPHSAILRKKNANNKLCGREPIEKATAM